MCARVIEGKREGVRNSSLSISPNTMLDFGHCHTKRLAVLKLGLLEVFPIPIMPNY